MGLKLFITGASGYLGSVLLTHLARMPESVRDDISFNGTRNVGSGSPRRLHCQQCKTESNRMDAQYGCVDAIRSAL